MLDILSQIISVAITLMGSFSAYVILGTVLALALTEIFYGAPDLHAKDGEGVTFKLFAIAVLTQVIFRGVDVITSLNLIAYGNLMVSEISPLYFFTTAITFISFALFFFRKHKKISALVFIFLSNALWLTDFTLTKSGIIGEGISSTFIVVSGLLMISALLFVQDLARRKWRK
jgi:hypothetical protein